MLSLFVNLLHKEGITEIEVPGLYVLDYEYHIKRNKKILSAFEDYWAENNITEDAERYKREKYYIEKSFGKEDLISEIITERLIFTFRRLLQHYSMGSIKNYPGELDSFMYLTIPVVRSKNDINGTVFKELYELNQHIDSEKEL